MSELEKWEKGFFHTLSLLGADLDKIMIVGGWCPFLYAHFLWKRKIPNIPATTDIDLGVFETGAKKFKKTLYEKLKTAGLASEKIYEDEELPVEFFYKTKGMEMKVEFITSFETTDDTLNRFLGSELACNRIEAFELLLENPLGLEIKTDDKKLQIQVPSPEAFFFHKAITFVMRSEDIKKDKDLFYVYFILKFCPDQAVLLKNIEVFRQHEFYHSFRENMMEYLSDISRPGYLILRPFIRRWVEEKNINSEIRDTFAELMKMF